MSVDPNAALSAKSYNHPKRQIIPYMPVQHRQWRRCCGRKPRHITVIDNGEYDKLPPGIWHPWSSFAQSCFVTNCSPVASNVRPPHHLYSFGGYLILNWVCCTQQLTLTGPYHRHLSSYPTMQTLDSGVHFLSRRRFIWACAWMHFNAQANLQPSCRTQIFLLGQMYLFHQSCGTWSTPSFHSMHLWLIL